MGAMSDLSALNLEAGSLVGGYTLISRLGSGRWDRSGACAMTADTSMR